MRMTVTRLYESITGECNLKDETFKIAQMTFDISADGVTDTKEVDEMIRQLQLLKSEIAGGCTKIICQPARVLNQTE